MINEKLLLRAAFVVLGLLLSATGMAQQSQPAQNKPKAAAKPVLKAAAPTFQAGIEPRAVDILKGASARLAAARTMAFTAVVSYESPSRLGPPLVYSTKSQVIMQRPDKLKIVTLGDGPPSEFYYDGKSMMALSPAENLVAVADAPPTIDAALQKAYDTAAIYFPFTDVIVTDPYKDIADGLKTAFYVGQSGVVGNTTTDMVAYVTGDVFVQAWIGTQDKLPRRIYAVYLNDRTRLRHVLELSNWELDAAVPASAFVSASAASAARIAFEPPDAKGGPGMKPPPKSRPAKGQ
ncbi:periplasmic-like protein [Burkholderiaceae bacterium 16]|nr:periplasmic-like protein [Burkholderiaceae bacterium 16]